MKPKSATLQRVCPLRQPWLFLTVNSTCISTSIHKPWCENHHLYFPYFLQFPPTPPQFMSNLQVLFNAKDYVWGEEFPMDLVSCGIWGPLCLGVMFSHFSLGSSLLPRTLLGTAQALLPLGHRPLFTSSPPGLTFKPGLVVPASPSHLFCLCSGAHFFISPPLQTICVSPISLGAKG